MSLNSSEIITLLNHRDEGINKPKELAKYLLYGIYRPIVDDFTFILESIIDDKVKIRILNVLLSWSGNWKDEMYPGAIQSILMQFTDDYYRYKALKSMKKFDLPATNNILACFDCSYSSKITKLLDTQFDNGILDNQGVVNVA